MIGMPSVPVGKDHNARTLLAEESAVPEADCPCPACRNASTLDERLEATAEHNAYVLHEDRRRLIGAAPAERLEQLREAIDAALSLERRLRLARLLSGQTLRHLRVWPEVIERGREEFLQPGRLRRRQSG